MDTTFSSAPSLDKDEGGRPSLGKDEGGRPSLGKDEGGRPSLGLDGEGRPSLSQIRQQARDILNGHSDGINNRLIFVLSLLIILTAAMTLYLILGGLYSGAAAILGDQPYLEPTADLLFGLCLVFVILPMLTALWRMASLMTAPDGEVRDGMTVQIPSVSVADVFYPFTSPRAYLRTMTVAMDALAWLILPLVLLLTLLPIHAALAWAEPHLPTWLTLGTLIMIVDGLFVPFCVLVGLLTFFLSGKRAGFGYFVFIHEELTVKDIKRYLRGFKRPLWRVFALRLSLAGWMILSVVGCLLPLLIHAAPYGLLCSASYAAGLERKRK